MNDTENILAKIWKDEVDKNRQCMFCGCNHVAINSHVLQKNGILREISENNHIIERMPFNLYEAKRKGIINANWFYKRGLNQAYTFKGFCAEHDTAIFQQIEKNNVDLFNTKNQLLFCYRALCQEIRRKEIAVDINMKEGSTFKLNLDSKMFLHYNLLGLREGIENLNFYKRDMESCLLTLNFDDYVFETIEIPKIDICISVPLDIGEIHDKYKRKVKLPTLPTCFVNIFPMHNSSFVICGYHKLYNSQWIFDFLDRVKSQDKKTIFQEISNLLIYRTEFFCMSPKLFHLIPEEKILKLKEIFQDNLWNYDEQLNSNINLFESMI